VNNLFNGIVTKQENNNFGLKTTPYFKMKARKSLAEERQKINDSYTHRKLIFISFIEYYSQK